MCRSGYFFVRNNTPNTIDILYVGFFSNGLVERGI